MRYKHFPFQSHHVYQNVKSNYYNTHRNTRKQTYIQNTLYWIFTSVTIVLGDLGQGEIPLPLCKYIAVLNEKIRCVRTVKEHFFSASSLKIIICTLIRGFFYVTGWWGGHEREGNTYIFSMRAYASSVSGLLLPSSPPERAKLSHTQEGINRSSTFGTTRNYQLNNLSLSSRVAGMKVNASNKQYWYKVRA